MPVREFLEKKFAKIVHLGSKENLKAPGRPPASYGVPRGLAVTKIKVENLSNEQLDGLLAAEYALAPRQYPEWHEWAKSLPAPAWLVQDLLPARGFTVLTGREKVSKKSFLAFDLAVSVATGHSVAGMATYDTGPVLYYYGEDTEKDIAERHECLAAGEGFDIAALDGIHFIHGQRWDISSGDYQLWFQAYCVRHGIKLFIIDTMNTVFFGNENDAQDVAQALNFVRRLNDLGTAVLLVHHVNKAGYATMGSKPDPNADLRGSGSIAGAASHHLAVRFYELVDDEEEAPAECFLMAIGKKINKAFRLEWVGMSENSTSFYLQLLPVKGDLQVKKVKK